MHVLHRIAIIGALLGTCLGAMAQTAAQPGGAPGLSPYVPTKLEWLALYLNATEGRHDFERDGFDIGFFEKGSDTVVIDCFYSRDVDRAIMNLTLNGIRKRIKMHIEARNWKWVRIEESIRLQE